MAAKTPLISTVDVEPAKVFAAGPYETQPFIIPVGATAFSVRIDRTKLPVLQDTCIKCQAWVSYDGGRKYDLCVGVTTNGGDYFSPLDGKTLITETSFGRGLKPQYKTNDRMMKIVMNMVQDLESYVKVEFY